MTTDAPLAEGFANVDFDLRQAPLISVVVPCFNQGRYLGAALDSLISQTYKTWQCTIVNDGSTDDTQAVAANYISRDSRIHLISQENRGLSAARNAGLAASHGEFIQFLDSDDFLLPSKFADDISAIEDSSSPCVVVSDYYFENEQGKRYQNRYSTPDLHINYPLIDLTLRWETELSIPIHAALFHYEFFKTRKIVFNEKLRNHEDWDLWMQVLKYPARIYRVRRPGAVYRVRSDSMSRAREEMWVGFRKAIELQMQVGEWDERVLRALNWKLQITDDFYSKTIRAKVRNWLIESTYFKRRVPWPIQQSIIRLLRPRPAEQEFLQP